MIYDVKAAMPIEIKRLHLLAEACKNAMNDEFKSLWYNKMIELADKYNLKDYVARKLIH
jgi:hypothetical protein